MHLLHKECQNDYFVDAYQFIHGARCPKCKGKMTGKKLAKTHEKFISEIADLYGNEYAIQSEYVRQTTKIRVLHNYCNNVFEIRPYSLLAGQGCPVCGRKRITEANTITHEEFIDNVFELDGNEYSVISQYIRQRDKVKLRHNLCGFEYFVTPNNFKRGKRCPKCSTSRGEKAISNYLDKRGIIYIPQYRFTDCVNIRPLPFDFAIFSNAYELYCLIEFDGIQHYKMKSFGESNDESMLNFEHTKYNDKIKTQYCLNKNIHLLRIPYYEINNIEQILSEKLHIS